MQEKQDSLTVTVKPADYPDNESFTTEPPPAYRQPRSTAVQVAKIVAVTVVAASAILGACILASAWIQARATCELMMMENQLHEAEIRAAEDRPQFQALVQESNEEVTTSTTSTPATSTTSQHEEESQENEIHRIKLPLQLDFDDLAGSLMERNQRAHMNCVVEKRRSEELVDHAPRELRLPFGLNLTTPPRLEHLSGERMVISCESGNQKEMPMSGAPMMIPLPMHLPMPFHPQAHQHQPEHHDMAMIVEQQHSAVPPVPLSAMVPPPQHHPMQQEQGRGFQHDAPRGFQHDAPRGFQPEASRGFQPEGRAFQGFPIPIHVHEIDSDDQQRDESSQHSAEARLFPGLVQIRQINVHEPQAMPPQMRPHYVQPRSVPSNPDFLQEKKRVKRCACNCDC